jgi:hypothetical protein
VIACAHKNMFNMCARTHVVADWEAACRWRIVDCRVSIGRTSRLCVRCCSTVIDSTQTLADC